MTQHVPALSVGCMAAAGLVAFAIPVGLLIYYRTKKKADDPPFVAGLVVFLLFALVLERIAHSLVLGSAAGETIRSNLWLYALYGGAMAGISSIQSSNTRSFSFPVKDQPLGDSTLQEIAPDGEWILVRMDYSCRYYAVFGQDSQLIHLGETEFWMKKAG